jgi:hypothetical protein
VWFDVDAPAGEHIQRVMVNGHPLEPKRKYRLAHTDAEASHESGYLQIDPAQTIETEVPTILREALEDDLRQRSPLPRPTSGRWNRSK